jgi:hypothetical protein
MVFDSMRPASEVFAYTHGYSPVSRLLPQRGVDVSGLPMAEADALNRALLDDERAIARDAVTRTFPGIEADLDLLDDKIGSVQPLVHIGMRVGHFVAEGLLREARNNG